MVHNPSRAMTGANTGSFLAKCSAASCELSREAMIILNILSYKNGAGGELLYRAAPQGFTKPFRLAQLLYCGCDPTNLYQAARVATSPEARSPRSSEGQRCPCCVSKRRLPIRLQRR